ncbi:MAG: spore coat protein CotH, partial [Phycisphaerales bacterium]|nr:spore coat protein CotH [Phycisphaerales bacterium]
MHPNHLLRIVAVSALFASLNAFALPQDAPMGPDGPRGPGGPGGPMGQERKLVKDFDKNDDGRLEGDELDAARAELKANPVPARGGMRGGMRGGPGGPGGGPPGMKERPATSAGRSVSPSEVAIFPDAPLYDTSIVRTIFLTIDQEDWEAELELFHGTDIDVPATMTVDGVSYAGVGVHFRGASSYMTVPKGSKRSLNVSIDHTDAKLRLHGASTLNLLNSNGDPSMLSTLLYSRLAAPHIPVPKANFVEVVVNGASWGVFVNVEQFNKLFVAEHWPQFKGEGARWKVPGSPQGSAGLADKGDDVAAYQSRYEIKSKARDEDWKDLMHLCDVLTNTPAEELEAKLQPILD